MTIRPGLMTEADLAAYTAPLRKPTKVGYRGLDVYGMAPPSSGGSTVGEALNILERFPLSKVGTTQALHHYLEASGLAFADRNRYVGDPGYVDVPLAELLSDGFAAERACLIKPDSVLPRPIAPGNPDGSYATKCRAGSSSGKDADHEGKSTTHLTTADRWGNVVAYTLTIEQTGGSGITVPGRGFILNNELTDFNFVDGQDGNDPNLPAPGKRPRSSMSPTIVLNRRQADARPRLPGRLDHHHHGAADPGQPDRPRDEPARGDRCAAGHPAQHRDHPAEPAFDTDGAGGTRAHVRPLPTRSVRRPRWSSCATGGCSRRPSRSGVAVAAPSWSLARGRRPRHSRR